jgi:hypothetical protein
MTADEVARSGPAARATPGTPDYGYGRTITPDSRNRATSLSGFPAP